MHRKYFHTIALPVYHYHIKRIAISHIIHSKCIKTIVLFRLYENCLHEVLFTVFFLQFYDDVVILNMKKNPRK